MTTASVPRIILLASAIIAGLAGSACQSSSLADLAPEPGVRNTGATPDLNVPQTAATAQFSNADAAAKTAALRAAQSGQGASAQGPAPVPQAQLLNAARVQAETLKQIEGE